MGAGGRRSIRSALAAYAPNLGVPFRQESILKALFLPELWRHIFVSDRVWRLAVVNRRHAIADSAKTTRTGVREQL